MSRLAFLIIFPLFVKKMFTYAKRLKMSIILAVLEIFATNKDTDIKMQGIHLGTYIFINKKFRISRFI